MRELFLASKSPRRRELLKRLGRPFRVIPHKADEFLPHGLSPHEAAEALAVRKAESVASQVRDGLVLGADTLVSVGEQVIGKPTSRAHAIEILKTLSRQPHLVITGVCLLDVQTGRRRVASECTKVRMRPMSREEIEAYVDSGEPIGKAGAYAIQESGDKYVKTVEGSFTNVIGLPLELVSRLLKEIEHPSGTE